MWFGGLQKVVGDVKAADEIDAHVGSRVRIRRMTLGVSQEQLADALGLTFQQIQKYEKGQNRIGAGRLFRISQILKVPVEFFYDGLDQSSIPDSDDTERKGAAVQNFMASPDGYALALAFHRIGDSATRRRIVDLVKTIAGEQA